MASRVSERQIWYDRSLYSPLVISRQLSGRAHHPRLPSNERKGHTSLIRCVHPFPVVLSARTRHTALFLPGGAPSSFSYSSPMATCALEYGFSFAFFND